LREASCCSVVVQLHDAAGVLQLAGRGEVAALRHPGAVDRGQPGRERARVARAVVPLAGVEPGLEVPVVRGAERHPLPLAVDDEAGRHRLHPAGRQPAHHLLPQHRGDLVAVQAVQDAPGLLRVDQVLVDVARVLDGVLDRAARDLVEDHPAHRHLGLELVEQVPGDRLALAVLVRGEVELVGLLEQPAQLADLLLLVAGHDVDRGEVLVDVDAEAGPRLALVLGRDLGGALRQVADVADRGLHDVATSEVARNRARLGRRLDDHEPPRAVGAGRGLASHYRSAPCCRADPV
jgi:hypothetical protein